MRREYHRWWSPSLHRDMELLEFGHGGARVIAFPTSRGRFHEWEDRGMVRALGHALEHGWLHLTCVDAVDGESWYAYHNHPGARAWRHEQYTHYVMSEVLPWVRGRSAHPYTIFTGASFGAFHALSMGLRFPERVNRVLPAALKLRRFVNLHKEFDADDGEITRTRKLRRNVVEERYAPIIDAIYAGQSDVTYQARIVYETGDVGELARELVIREV